MSFSLARKYRPNKLSDVVGQRESVETIKNFILSGKVPQAFLFFGTRGAGKTTTARILAKILNCLGLVNETPCNKCKPCISIDKGGFSDVIEVDAASNTGVDNIRTLRENAFYSPLEGKSKVYIIDEAHMLSKGAFNALLKIMEEPPPNVYFILVTTELDKVPLTVRSRCQLVQFRSVPITEISCLLKKIHDLEKGGVKESELFEIIAQKSCGSVRDAVIELEKILSTDGTTASTFNIVSRNSEEYIADLAYAIINYDAVSILSNIELCSSILPEQKTIVKMLEKFFANCVIVNATSDTSFCNGTKEHVLRCVDAHRSLGKVKLHEIFDLLLCLEEKLDKHNDKNVLEVGILSLVA